MRNRKYKLRVTNENGINITIVDKHGQDTGVGEGWLPPKSQITGVGWFSYTPQSDEHTEWFRNGTCHGIHISGNYGGSSDTRSWSALVTKDDIELALDEYDAPWFFPDAHAMWETTEYGMSIKQLISKLQSIDKGWTGDRKVVFEDVDLGRRPPEFDALPLGAFEVEYEPQRGGIDGTVVVILRPAREEAQSNCWSDSNDDRP